MATTSLKLPDDVEQRAVAAARHQGLTTHAFMVDAIRSAAEAAEQRAVFVAKALTARDKMLRTGAGFEAADVHAYVLARARGKAAVRPKAQSWYK